MIEPEKPQAQGELGRGFGALALAACMMAPLMAPLPVAAKDTIRIAAQKTGTFAWELAIIRAHEVELYPPDQRLSAEELAALADLPGAADRSTVPSATKLLTMDTQDR